MASLSDAVDIKLPSAEEQEVLVRSKIPVPASLFDSLSTAETPAIRAAKAGEAALQHRELRRFLAEGHGRLGSRGITAKDVVAIVMPNGPELATALLACACQCVAAPVDQTTSEGELVAAFQMLGVKHVIALHRSGGGPPEPVSRAAAAAGCELHALRPVEMGAVRPGLFEWVGPALSTEVSGRARPWLGVDDTALVLRTSGTTSKPKIVPLSARGLYTGALCIGRGLELTPEDVSLNVMPLTHIGGISCSLFAALFTGGSVICATGFDPARFVGWLEELRPTWYYAVPTIHKAVALFARTLPAPVKHCLRLVRSGAANLADADARELRELFQCCVLPTYSMSECMPIAQPPLAYKLERPGSVGLPIASSLRIAGDTGDALPFGTTGEVCIRGPVVTLGYQANEAANSASFFGEPDEEGFRWFRTGDVGHIDRDGYLFLTGRSKELIKRGGEQVSPYEVEEVLLTHPAVEVAVVFGVANDFWGEEVAAAVVLRPHAQLAASAAAAELRRHAAAQLPDSRLPRQVVVLESIEQLPKTRTGKYIRAGLASRLGLTAVDTQAAARLTAAAALAGGQGNAGMPGQERDAEAGECQRRGGRPVKPSRAVYGLRYFLAVWVIFIHVGPNAPDWLGTWKNYSASMPGYFILAGFLLASSCNRPVESKRQFYRNRIIAAHPLYLLSVIYSLPLTFIVCPPGSMGISEQLVDNCALLNQGLPVAEQVHAPIPGTYVGQVIYIYAMAFFAQMAWPWGALGMFSFGFFNPVLWFSSAYYFCILCFPFFHKWIHSRCLMGSRPREYCCRPLFLWYTCWPMGIMGILITVGCYGATQVIPPALTLITDHFQDPVLREVFYGKKFFQGINGFIGYSFPVIWAFIFFLGMLTYKTFEMNRSGQNVQVWRHWGKLTDAISIFMGLTLAVGSILWEVDPEHGGPEDDFGPAGLSFTVGEWWARPGRLLLMPLCLWVYGLACGDGLTAKLMSTRVLVNYLSPAAYSVYLFHFPTNMYWYIFKLKILHWWGPSNELDRWWYGIVDYLVVVVLATCVALIACHKLNAPITALFMRAFDQSCGLFCRSRPGCEEEVSTLQKLVDAVRGLSGAEVDAKTPIAECGLDSFGTSALLGVIRPKFPGLTLTPLEVYRLHTVGDLAERIDAEVGGAYPCAADSPPRRLPGAAWGGGMREPLAANADAI